MEKEQKYNGFTNYETWCVNLWLTNDEGLNELAREAGRHNSEPYDCGQSLKNLLTDEMLPEVTGLYSDLLNAALGSVNWTEIGEDFAEEEEPESDDRDA